MKVYIHYNGDELVRLQALSQDCANVWGNLGQFDSLRMALMARHSWQRLGWQAEWIQSSDDWQGWGPRAVNSGFPARLWNLWSALLEMEPPFIVSQIDVLNFAYEPRTFNDLWRNMSLGNPPTTCCFGIMSMHKVKEAIGILKSWSHGEYYWSFPHSDEAVLRELGWWERSLDMVKHDCDTTSPQAPLVHFSRGSILSLR